VFFPTFLLPVFLKTKIVDQAPVVSSPHSSPRLCRPPRRPVGKIYALPVTSLLCWGGGDVPRPALAAGVTWPGVLPCLLSRAALPISPEALVTCARFSVIGPTAAEFCSCKPIPLGSLYCFPPVASGLPSRGLSPIRPCVTPI
jgi:hypothetical protein